MEQYMTEETQTLKALQARLEELRALRQRALHEEAAMILQQTQIGYQLGRIKWDIADIVEEIRQIESRLTGESLPR
jgi:hypothetical protein